MEKMLHYNDYYGTINFSVEDNILYGKVIGIKGVLSYEGRTLEELNEDFKNTVNEYINDCKERNIIPQKSYKGSFNVRLNPDLHRDLAIYAKKNDESLNSAVEKAIKQYIHC